MAKQPAAKLKLNPPLGRMPVLQFLRPSELRIDPCYQRSAAGGESQVLIRRIAQNWDWDLCLPLAVARREGLGGDRYFVIDGQHRLEAARVRGDIDQLPCVILNYTDVAREAESFVKLNQQRRPLGKLDLFKAAVASGNKEAVAILAAMADAGLSLAPHNNPKFWKPGMLANVAGIENAWRKRGERATTTALRAMGQAYAGQVLQLAGTIFPGIAMVCAGEIKRAGTFTESRFEKFVTMLAIRSQDDWRRDIGRIRVEKTGLSLATASEEVLVDAWRRAGAEARAAPPPPPPLAKPAPTFVAPPPSGLMTTGKRWCDQCDRSVDHREVATCQDKFCKGRKAA